jgi:quercetin dioxygenase-like cupin family protein
MHHVQRGRELRLASAYSGNSRSFARCALVDGGTGSVHMGLGLCELGPIGHVDIHIHSFEESFYVLEGSPTVVIDRRAYPLSAGACGLIPVGTPHAWIEPIGRPARWIDMLAPQPRSNGAPADTFFLGPPAAYDACDFDLRDPRSPSLFHVADNDIELDRLKAGSAVDAPTVSASMNTALLAYSGIALKMLVDRRLGAELSTMFLVEYQPGGVAHPHDHPLEEAYFILDGQIEAIADGCRYVLDAGDVFWTGVGCIHGFHNTSGGRVRWLETQSPQLPARYGYRFNRDWEYLKEKLSTRECESHSLIATDRTCARRD